MRGIHELREYLGDKFDAAGFERGDELYLYATISDDEWRVPYLDFVREVVPPCGVLDYGGVGSPGLILATYGYTPSFVCSKATATFVKWRIKQRGLDAPVYSTGKASPAHLVVCFDQLHRVESPGALLKTLSTLGDIAIVNVDSRALDVDEIVAQIDGILIHKIINVYFHLIAFAGKPAEAQDLEVNDNG